jgi:hypothetical protein
MDIQKTSVHFLLTHDCENWLSNNEDDLDLIYGGFVNWNHSGELKNAINQIKRELR